MANYGKSLPNKWTKMFKRLQTYQQEHDGSCNVPQGYPQDPKLGRWVKKQRNIYKKGSLAKERCDQLESIGFEWTVREQTEWTEMFKRLQAYQKGHNSGRNVPRGYPQDPKLGRWVNTQRENYKKGLLAKERCDQLDSIGFELKRNREQTFQDQWAKMFKRLQAYQQEHNGSCNVPQGYPQDTKLGRWAMTQRSRHKKGLLAKERYEQLNGIGFEWRSTQTNREQAKMQPDPSGNEGSRRWCWL